MKVANFMACIYIYIYIYVCVNFTLLKYTADITKKKTVQRRRLYKEEYCTKKHVNGYEEIHDLKQKVDVYSTVTITNAFLFFYFF